MGSRFRANDRINLYPAAPIRLATMLHTWTITIWGMGLISGMAVSQSGHAVTHPTRQQGSGLLNSLLALAHSRFEDGALGDQPGFQITPERNRQLSCQGNNHDAPDTSLLTLGAVMEPLA